MPPFELYTHPLCPQAGKVQLALGEKGLEASLVQEKPWLRREDFLRLNPAGDVPVLVVGGQPLSDSLAICQYLDLAHPQPTLFSQQPWQQAEILRLGAWFEGKFHHEVSAYLLEERVFKRLKGQGQPDAAFIRAGVSNMHYHLDYIGFLTEKRNWLAGDSLSYADLAAAGQLYTLDYLGLVPWEEHAGAKAWYMKLKSRPSFRVLLAERLPGVLPALHYTNLDF